jgi:hypothetical protein
MQAAQGVLELITPIGSEDEETPAKAPGQEESQQESGVLEATWHEYFKEDRMTHCATCCPWPNED